jgi:hypothetical protein
MALSVVTWRSAQMVLPAHIGRANQRSLTRHW